jgi:antitoxin PrlF
LNKRDRLCYTIDPDGRVTITKAEQSHNDPTLENFLIFLERDLKQNPQHLSSIDSTLYDRVSSLVDGVDIDLDAPLSDEVD